MSLLRAKDTDKKAGKVDEESLNDGGKKAKKKGILAKMFGKSKSGNNGNINLSDDTFGRSSLLKYAVNDDDAL